MNPEWIRSGLDVALIVLIAVGLVQATRLIWHLAGLRASRAEMERFVRDFNAAVIRAEAGIKALKSAARDSGDDLEKLVGKATMVRDELQFIVESADQLAERLTNAATAAAPAARPEIKTPAPAQASPAASAAATPAAQASALAPAETKTAPESQKPSSVTPLTARREAESKPASRAEKELMQALQKLN